MRISIFGSDYVGLLQAAVFYEVGHQITCMDIDPARLERIEGYAKNDLNACCVIRQYAMDKASTAKNKNSCIAISACLSVNSTPAKKWVRAPSPHVLHLA